MICEKVADKHVMVNIGRPSFFNDQDFQLWGEIFDLIELSEIKIAVNGIYAQMREYCNERQGYGFGAIFSGSFAFNFWFNSQEDCDTFEQGLHAIHSKYGIPPRKLERYPEILEWQ